MSLLVIVLVAGMLLLASRHHYESLKVLAGAFSSLFATIAGAFLAFWFALLQIEEQTRTLNEAAESRRQLEQTAARQDLAFELHREFLNESMLRARTEASRLLAGHPDKTFNELYQALPEVETRPLFLVTQFYDRLALAVLYERVDLLLVPKLFGLYYVWWWTDEFEKKLIAPDPGGEETGRLQQLYDFLKRETDPAQFERWRTRAGPPAAAGELTGLPTTASKDTPA